MAKMRRGQAEIIGGIIILTILIALIMPVVLNSFTDITRISEDARRSETRIDIKLKERLSIAGVSQEQVGPDLWPAIWVNNTGTVQVSIEYLYLIDTQTGAINAVIDLTKARPWNSPIIKQMMLNPDPALLVSEPIPNNTAIQLKPGDRLFIAFNSTHPALSNPETLVIRILSATGVLHPMVGGSNGDGFLVPQAGTVNVEVEPWKGAFNPYAGFKLIGGSDLVKNGVIKLFRPKIVIQTPFDVEFYSTFIYDDEVHPGLYRVTLVPAESFRLNTNYGDVWISSGSSIEFIGFIGTYHFYTDPDTGANRVYIYGYAADILVDGYSLFGYKGILSLDPSGTYEISDFDANGVNELVMYTLKNGPNYGYSTNPDADLEGNYYWSIPSTYDDSVVWSYMTTRDISGQDFIRITVKINYYWTQTAFGGDFTSPSRDLRIFMIAVWEYNNITDSWILRHYRDFSYTSEKPKQYQFSAVFPLDKDKVYRVGVLFFDSYRLIEWDRDVAGWSYTWNDPTSLEFTYALEYIVVEYGRYNPLFSVTPPIYIVAIPDPAKIRNIGEAEYLTTFNLTNIDDAKLAAQAALLDMVKTELEDAGLTDYVIITSVSELCNILFSSPNTGLPDTPPKRAVIVWLQGDMDISTVSEGCADNNILKNSIISYKWIFTQMTGDPLWGSLSLFGGSYFNVQAEMLTANITSAGIQARIEYRAYLMPITAEFTYTITALDTTCIIQNATFYSNTTLPDPRYGSVAIWVDCLPDPDQSGIVVLVTTDVDWAGDGGGIQPAALVEIAVYSALQAYKVFVP